jgi:nitrile hydratase beta subunit
MNGAQDMGGMHGFGPVMPEPDEPVFHETWEARVLALTVAMGAAGEWNIDQGRFAREDRPPADYLSKTYYEVWLAGLERLLDEHGVLERPPRRVLRAEDVPTALATVVGSDREPPGPARFAVGDRVRTRNLNPRTHTRLPRYARDKLGTVILVHGAHVFPDSRAHGKGDDPQWLYTVRFSARDLFGPDADPKQSSSIDAWEPYLDPA